MKTSLFAICLIISPFISSVFSRLSIDNVGLEITQTRSELTIQADFSDKVTYELTNNSDEVILSGSFTAPANHVINTESYDTGNYTLVGTYSEESATFEIFIENK